VIRDVTREARGKQFQSANSLRETLNDYGDAKSRNNLATTFFNTVHLLPKDIRFEHGGTKLAFCPRHHLALLRPWV